LHWISVPHERHYYTSFIVRRTATRVSIWKKIWVNAASIFFGVSGARSGFFGVVFRNRIPIEGQHYILDHPKKEMKAQQ